MISEGMPKMKKFNPETGIEMTAENPLGIAPGGTVDGTKLVQEQEQAKQAHETEARGDSA